MISLYDFDDNMESVFDMATDIQDALMEMEKIDISTVPRFRPRFYAAQWQAVNPLYHPEVYALDRDQLKIWGEEATLIRM